MPVGAPSYSVLPSVSYKEPLQGRPRFMYIAGDIVLEPGSPEVNCCRRARNFWVYNQDGPRLLPRGICCRNCYAEYLDVTVYDGVSYQESEVEVRCMETESDMDTDMENSVCKSGQFVVSQSVILKRKRSNFSENRYFAFMSMVQPHRRYINHKDPRAIDELRPGDHIAWHRSYTIWHHQLIRENKGNGKCDVIHFNPSESSYCERKAEVRYRNDFDFTSDDQNGTAYKILYDDLTLRENPVDLVFDRANSRLLEQNYNIFVNNCEHFVTFCKTGKQKSMQIIWLGFQIFFMILRFLILSGIIVAIVVSQYNSYDEITKQEEKMEVLYLIFVEGTFVFLVVSWHQRLYRKMAIGKLDRKRRIIEGIVEAVCTILIYAVHIALLNDPSFCKAVSNSGWKGTVHVTLAVFFGVVGKIIGCFAGNYLSQLTGVDETPRERPPLYGAVTVHRW